MAYVPTEEELKVLGFEENFGEDTLGNYGRRFETIDGHNDLIWTYNKTFVIDVYSGGNNADFYAYPKSFEDLQKIISILTP